jgi:hypothetical protein
MKCFAVTGTFHGSIIFANTEGEQGEYSMLTITAKVFFQRETFTMINGKIYEHPHSITDRLLDYMCTIIRN